ncbi:hypothetical protein ZIOFF_063550 [Zingiber officinale]|uniref:Uncharacterized protein n=1 Tax=Zingiber officinale TaxID=94328 RepID=A0A8J5KH03_ZINOF|nr:hypothetical protein ZIOFF_063550 [Zingiber officinale]
MALALSKLRLCRRFVVVAFSVRGGLQWDGEEARVLLGFSRGDCAGVVAGEGEGEVEVGESASEPLAFRASEAVESPASAGVAGRAAGAGVGDSVASGGGAGGRRRGSGERGVGAMGEGSDPPSAVCLLGSLPPSGPPPPPLCHGGAASPPVHVSPANPLLHLGIKDTPIQYTAASGGLKLLSSIRNAYAMGKVKMVASEFETATGIAKSRNATDAESGGFVLWQMAPEMWYVELAIGGSKVRAGCDGKLGLDPLITANMFADAQCIGKRNVNGEDCFILKLCADPRSLKARSEGPAEIIRHVLFGYFSQKTGLLTHVEDSHLTRIQSSAGGDAVYWETSINSSIDDYRPVEGMMIAHSGRSVVNLFRFGEVAMSHSKTRMEEEWTIDEVAFNVPGLSLDCFIPPANVKRGTVSEACELPQQSERGRGSVMGSNRSKVAALEKPHDVDNDNILWRDV